MKKILHPLTIILLSLLLTGAGSGSVYAQFTPTLYRALNLNGAALTIDGNSWQSSTGAANFSMSQSGGGTFANQSVTLVPSTDANRATMIRSSIYGNVTLNVTSVPNGTYDVFLYVWEDNNNEIYSILLEGSVVQSNYNSGSTGTWAKLGPYRATIADGGITVSTTGGAANLSGLEIWTANTPPSVSTPIPDQTALIGQPYNFSFGANTFSDSDPGTTLTYTATLSNGNPLPSWLAFNATTRSFTGTPTSGDAGSANVRVIASDGDATVEDVFTLSVVTGFYRAINLNGSGTTIDGDNWEAMSGATGFTYSLSSGGLVSDPSAILNPATDANRAAMIRTAVYGNTINLNMASVPNGTYDIYIYLWEDNGIAPHSITIEGTTVLSNYSLPAPTYWAKVGPFKTTMTDGTINIVSSGSGHVNISGLEVRRAATGTISVSEVSLSPAAVTLAVGQAARLNKTVSPQNATNQNVTWSSTNTSVATVDNTGLVRAVAAGTANITLTSDDGGHTATSTITVDPAGNNVLANPEFDLGLNNWSVTNYLNPPGSRSVVQGAGLSGTNALFVDMASGNASDWMYTLKTLLSFRLEVGRTYRISFMAKAQTAKSIGVTLRGESSNTAYWITPVSLTTSVQKFNFNYTCNQSGVASEQAFSLAFYLASNPASDVWLDNIRVEDITGTTPVTGASLSPATLALTLGQTGQLTPAFTPSNATNKNITWTSSNPAVATVNASGLVTAVSNGSATISAYTASGGYTATSTVNVTGIPVTGVTVSPTTLNLAPGQTGQLTPTIAPANATDQSVTWSTDTPGVATVDNNGLVTAVSAGTATITVTTTNGGFTFPVSVTVSVPVTGVSLSHTSVELVLNETVQLTASVIPSNASNQSVTWSTSDANVATVNSGLVTAVGAGTATITVTSVDGSFNAQTTVTVGGPATVSTVLNDFAFQYNYDGRKRMTQKKVPGAEWVYMVYDNRDRLVMTQDGEQRKAKEWTFTKYDQLNRPVLTGIYTDTETPARDQEAMQAAINNFYDAADQPGNTDEWFEVMGGAVHGYTNNSFPKVSTDTDYLTITYYDDYGFQSLIGSTATDFDYDGNQLTASGNDPGQRTEEFTRVQGQVTGTKIRNLDTNEFLWSVNYYDDRYRVIQMIAQNNKGGLDKITNVYDFVGKILRTKTDHAISGANAIATTRKLTYDHTGRLLQTEHTTGGADPIVLAKNEYNELGQLVSKKLHSEDEISYKQQVDYRYNIRGWLTRINDSDLSEMDGGPKDYFGMELGYNETLGIGTAGQYNGNISAMKWSTNLGSGFNDAGLGILEPTARAYAYTYDPMNRLKTSAHFEKNLTWTPVSGYHENIGEYDLNGNIRLLNRTGKGGNDMDDLEYAFQGNRLMKVIDDGNDTEGFKDGNTTGNDYLYDDNGNMIIDKNKSIAAIEYNHLNLPAKVMKTDGQYVKYIYNAAGMKMRQEVYDASNNLKKQTDYLGEFLYENDTLKFINHEEGRIVITETEPEYQYTLKDHLGNTRITFTTKHEIETFEATMDGGSETDEQGIFGAYNSYINEPLDPTPAENATDKILVLNGSALMGSNNGQVGLTKSFSVVPGDIITASVNAKYEQGNGSGDLTGFASALTQAFMLTPAPGPIEGITPYEALNAFGAVIASGGRDEDENLPQGFLNILVFDKDYNLVDAAFEQVGTSVTLTSSLEIRQAGYVYVFLSNDGVSQQQIGFDNYSVTHEHSDVIQQDDYYPFGLTFNSYQRENSVKQKFKFQGQEHIDDLDLGWDSFKWRNHQPDIGRFFNVDPIAEKYYYNSPYAFSENKVVAHIELEGLEAVPLALPRPLVLPRVGPILPPGEIVLPPTTTMNVPPHANVGQPSVEATNKTGNVDWNNPPSSPDELGEGWEETTDSRNESGSRDFRHNESKEEVRWDPGKEDKPGWEGKNHWHRNNPERTGKKDYYLDKNGNPVPRGSGPSHIEAPSLNLFQKSWQDLKNWYKKDLERRREESTPSTLKQIT